MKLKTVHVPRGYDGLHLEIEGAIVNVYQGLTGDNLEPRTRVEVICDNYAEAGGRWHICDVPEPELRHAAILIQPDDGVRR